jgi:hypothetical protein
MIPTTVHPGELNSATIQSIQQELKQAGYDPGPVDGRWGSHTKVAYTNFLAGTPRGSVVPLQREPVLNTTSYYALRPEYERRFANCKVLDQHLINVRALVNRVFGYRLR